MSNARRLGYRLLLLRAGGSLVAGSYGLRIHLMDQRDGIFREVLIRLLEPLQLQLPPEALSVRDKYGLYGKINVAYGPTIISD